MTENPQNEKDDLAALAWQVEMGADEAITDAPVDRFKEVEQAPVIETKMKSAAPAKAAPPPHPPAAAEDAEKLAAGAKTLEQLKAAIEAFEGCSLKKTAMNTVFSRGDASSGLMLVGEAPGAEEDRQGKPFVGASGRLLDKMMAAIGRERGKDYYISNILPWRPPGNRKPTPAEQVQCLPFIKRHIELAAPKVLVLLGGTSVSALLDITDGITRVRGRWYTYPAGKEGIPAMATFHPAYLLRQPQLKRQAWQDLLEIKSKLDG